MTIKMEHVESLIGKASQNMVLGDKWERLPPVAR